MGNSLPSFGTTNIPTAVPSSTQVVIPQITLQQPNNLFNGLGLQSITSTQPLYEQIGPQLLKVHGTDGAKQFPTVPNAVYALFDDTDNIMFFKATDKNNYPILLKRFRYAEEEETVPVPPEYVTKQEYESLLSDFEKLKEEIESGKQHIQPAVDNAASIVSGNSRNANSGAGSGKQSDRR